MEYKNTYDYFYNKTYSLGEIKIKDALIKAKSESKKFRFVLDRINTKNTELIAQKSKVKSNKSLTRLESIFKISLENYTENNIELALKNDVHPEYLKLKGLELPPNYSFKKFTSDLGSMQGLNDVDYIFCEKMDFYKEKYEQNDLEDFKIPQPENKNIEDAIIMAKTQKQHSLKRNHLSAHTKIETDSASFTTNRLTNEEKSFLFYTMCKVLSETKGSQTNEGFNLPFTELIRLNTIIDFEDKFCFENNFRDSNNYKILAKGIEYFTNGERIAFLKTLIEKTNDLMLPKTTKYIKEMLNREHNKK